MSAYNFDSYNICYLDRTVGATPDSAFIWTRTARTGVDRALKEGPKFGHDLAAVWAVHRPTGRWSAFSFGANVKDDKERVQILNDLLTEEVDKAERWFGKMSPHDVLQIAQQMLWCSDLRDYTYHVKFQCITRRD